jgi:hypothetical protein
MVLEIRRRHLSMENASRIFQYLSSSYLFLVCVCTRSNNNIKVALTLLFVVRLVFCASSQRNKTTSICSKGYFSLNRPKRADYRFILTILLSSFPTEYDEENNVVLPYFSSCILWTCLFIFLFFFRLLAVSRTVAGLSPLPFPSLSFSRYFPWYQIHT